MPAQCPEPTPTTKINFVPITPTLPPLLQQFFFTTPPAIQRESPLRWLSCHRFILGQFMRGRFEKLSYVWIYFTSLT